VTPDEKWLRAVWPIVAAHVPRSAATVLDVGCGPLGGFVPMLAARGHDAKGVDPQAPVGDQYDRRNFEELPVTLHDALVACTSLHHMADLPGAVDALAKRVSQTGVLVVVEWAWERFDERTARWCFDLLPEDGTWLHGLRDGWLATGGPWDSYIRDWARHRGMHAGSEVETALGERFALESLGDGPYFFPDLPNIDAVAEREAIAMGRIAATTICRLGRRRKH
jgi:SAM-dependent methyltransferase